MGGLHKEKQCPIVVKPTTHARLKAEAQRRGWTMDQLIAWLLEQEMSLS